MIAILSFALALTSHVAGQGFAGTCHYLGANLTDHFLGMYCNDDNWAVFDYKWTCELPSTSSHVLIFHGKVGRKSPIRKRARE
jgi:hypothetical protein